MQTQNVSCILSSILLALTHCGTSDLLCFAQCLPRQPTTRASLLKDTPFGKPGMSLGPARKAYTSQGLHPFILPSIEDPAFSPFTGPPSVLPSMHMPADNMHMVCCVEPPVCVDWGIGGVCACGSVHVVFL